MWKSHKQDQFGVVKYSRDVIGIHLCVEDVIFAIDGPVTV